MRNWKKVQKQTVKRTGKPFRFRAGTASNVPTGDFATVNRPKRRFWRTWKMIEMAALLIAAAAFVVSIYSALWTRDALVETQHQTQLAREANQATLEALKETQRQTTLALEANEVTKRQLEFAQQEAERGRIVSAWSVLTTKARGNSGKKEALETLINLGVELEGLDLSCKTMGGWDAEKDKCETGVFLDGVTPHKTAPRAKMADVDFSGVDLHKAQLVGAELVSANFSSALLGWANLSQADLKFADFSGANFGFTDFTGADLRYADFTNAFLSNVRFEGAKLGAANLANHTLHGINLSGADFCSAIIDGEKVCAPYLKQEQLDQAWAWADRPPILGTDMFGRTLHPPPLCDPSLRPAYLEKRSWDKPEGC